MSTCYICQKGIPEARLDFLKESGVSEFNMTCLQHSQVAKKQAIYLGEHGTSDLILCNKVYNDSLRAKFSNKTEDSD